MEKTCGDCVHIDQLSDGFRRWCDVRNRYVEALGYIRCAAYQSIWEKDLFGYTEYERMKALSGRRRPAASLPARDTTEVRTEAVAAPRSKPVELSLFPDL